MFVVYKCEACGADVNSNMGSCTECGSELQDISLESGFDAEIDEEPYEIEHPILSKFWKVFDTYSEHIFDVVVQDAEMIEEIEEESKRVRKEQGYLRSILRKWRRNLQRNILAIVYAILFLVPIPFVIEAENPISVWLKFVTYAFPLLYIISLLLMAKGDTLEISFVSKLIRNALSAFNRLVFAVVCVGLLFLSVQVLNKYWFMFLGYFGWN